MPYLLLARTLPTTGFDILQPQGGIRYECVFYTLHTSPSFLLVITESILPPMYTFMNFLNFSLRRWQAFFNLNLPVLINSRT